MSTPVTLIAYRNWVVEFGSVDDPSGWEPEAPLSDMLTPRPGEIAIHAGAAGDIVWRINVGAPGASSSENAYGRPVHVVALVNCNIVMDPGDAPLIVVRGIDQDGAEKVCTARAIITHGGVNGFQRTQLLFLLYRDATDAGEATCDLDRVVALQFEIDSTVRLGMRDQWTGAISPAPLFSGTVIGGPAWLPTNGLRLIGFAPGVTDPSPSVKAIGGTDWTAPLARPRTLNGEFALLPESEIEARPPNMGLRQLAEFCGTSRPLLVIPDIRDDQLMHEQACYGLLTEPITWAAVDKMIDDELQQIGFRAPLTMRESR